MKVFKYNIDKLSNKELKILEKRFRIYEDIENAMLGKAKGNLMSFLQDPCFNKCKNMKKSKEKQKAFKDLEAKYKLNSSDYDNLAKKYLAVYSKNADSDSLQNLGKRVKKSIDTFRFGDGKRVHFRKRGTLETIEGKQFDRCMIFNPAEKLFSWKGLNLHVSYRKGDSYMEDIHMQLVDEYNNTYLPFANEKARVNILNPKRKKLGMEPLILPSRPKFKLRYVTLVRKLHKNKFKYYLYVTVDGVSPIKMDKKTGDFKHKPLNKEFAVDLGTSTSAAVNTDCDIFFEELASGVNDRSKEIEELQRIYDNKLRINNPDNYNADGTIRKGKKKWVISNDMRRIRKKINYIHRCVTAAKHDLLKHQCNIIISTIGINGKIEPMKIKNLQKKSKETKLNPKTNRPYSKKRYGKSIKKHCPGLFETILRQKCENAGGRLEEIDSYTLKPSQFNHISREFVKKNLNNRYNCFNFYKYALLIQRDLYSAFLILNSDLELNIIDIDKCNKLFSKFILKHNIKMAELSLLKKNGSYFPTCMGVK